MHMNLYRTVLRELERSKARQREQRRQRFLAANTAAKNSHANVSPNLTSK